MHILRFLFILIFVTTSCSLGGNEVAWASKYWQEDIASYHVTEPFITLAGASVMFYYHNNDGQIWLDAKHNLAKSTANRRKSIIQKVKAIPIIAKQDITVSEQIWQEVLLADERYVVCKNLALLSLDNRQLNPQDYAECPGIKISSLAQYTTNNYIAFIITQESSYQLFELIQISVRKILDIFADYDPAEVSLNYARVKKQNAILIFSQSGNLEWVGEGEDLNAVLFLLEKGMSKQSCPQCKPT